MAMYSVVNAKGFTITLIASLFPWSNLAAPSSIAT